MAYRARVVTDEKQADPYSGSSLVPMLVIGHRRGMRQFTAFQRREYFRHQRPG